MAEQLPWKPIIIERFKKANPSGMEKEYYPGWNALLTTTFNADDGFIVAPVTYPLGEKQSIDFTLEYQVEFDFYPVLLVEIKAPSLFRNSFHRQEADDQIRKRFKGCLADCPLKTLKAISAFGTIVCIYEASKETRTITPPYIPRSNEYVTDDPPQSQWSENILEPLSSQRINTVFNEIKFQCKNLNK